MARHESQEPEVTSEHVTTRASGRPPEEAGSENPEDQARAILEDSEERTSEGADRSTASET